MRKGMFFSVTAVIFVSFLLILLNNKSELQKNNIKLDINRLQVSVMDGFVKDFDQYYVEQALETAAKHALSEGTKKMSLPIFRSVLQSKESTF